LNDDAGAESNARADKAAGGAPTRPESPVAVRPMPATRARLSTVAWIACGVLGAVILFYLLAPILTPFALAAVLAYMLNPGVDWCERHRVPRSLGSALMVVLSAAVILGLVLVLIPVLEREVAALDARLPTLVSLANTRVAPLLEQWFGVQVDFDVSALKALALQHVGQQDISSALVARFGSGGLAVIGVLGTLFLVPVVLFYVLVDAHQFVERLDAALPRAWHEQTVSFFAEIDSVLAQFLRGQLTVMGVLAVYYSVALALAGFNAALPIGLLTGLLIFIPYIGFALGLLLAVLAAALEVGTWQALLSVAVVYGAGYILEGFFLTPRLVGRRIGLHPLAVIFALLAFGHVFGFFGVLVALPSSAVLLVALRRLRSRYLASDFYRGT
jgi:predicted PurR-regulated permease PerM